MLQRKCQAEGCLGVCPSLLVCPSLKFGSEESLQHPTRVRLARSDAILRGVTVRVVDLLSNGDQDLAAEESDRLVLLFRLGRVEAKPLRVSMDTLFNLEDNLLLFFTGYSRSAGDILRDQNVRSREADPSMLDNLHYVKELGFRSQRALEMGDTHRFGEIMHEHWEHKKRRSGGMSNSSIDDWYELGRRNGAIGGKLVGAGGGGFLLFYAENHRCLREAMTKAGLEEVRFRFDFDGTKVLFS